MTTFSVTRRRALRLALSGGVALATTAIALSGSVASTILAQQSGSSVQLIGVEAGAVPTTNDVPEVSTTELDSAGNPVNGAVAIPIVVQTVDLATGQVQTVSTPQSLPDGTPLLQSDEVVTGI
ncbi:MAG: hypothetical protein JO352_21310, partial [Chloroflexi bacterium]|nr:hypothetical protein [Chloroflexota bacterium]